jgi:hypothetical protein
MTDRKRAMISQPMYGRTNDEIFWIRNKIKDRLESLGYEVVDSFISEECNAENIKSKPLWYLAKSLEVMSTCDAVCFAYGWERARGCRIEHAVADAYGLSIFVDKEGE